MMGLIYCFKCLVIAFGLVAFSESFNIDVESAEIYQGQKDTAFGYNVEFIEISGQTRLLVTAHKKNVKSRKQSGFFYICYPRYSESPPCRQLQAPPEKIQGSQPENFSEQVELFGLGMTMADKDTGVICGPHHLKQHWWNHSHMFNLGRCESFTNSLNSPVFKSVKPFLSQNGSNYVNMSTSRPKNGAAMFGFSAAGDEKGSVILGAPGVDDGKGTVVVLKANTSETFIMEKDLDQETYDYLGYSVAVGNFCGYQKVCFVTSNRHVEGKVYLITFQQASRAPFRLIQSWTGEQVYSSFGSALCATDVNGDGWADLLIGAPTHSASLNEPISYDEGRVFVYISHGEVYANEDNFRKPVSLNGDGVPFARFGSAIASIGDINRDTINDIAVGAPLEEDGAGALYVYLGSPKGLNSKYSQKIRGKDFNPTLSLFGSHISKPTHTLSSYDYPDFAVGAPGSDSVVVFKTRLIVNAKVTVQVTPNPVDLTSRNCEQSGLAGRICTNVTLCLSLDFKAIPRNNTVALMNFQVNMDMDRLVASDSSRRIRLVNPEIKNNTHVTSYNTIFSVDRGRPECRNYWAVLDQNTVDRNLFTPVEIFARFSQLSGDTKQGTIAPILNQSMPTSYTEHVKFQNKCGEDSVCQTDLVLSGRVQHLPPLESRYLFNVVNHTSQVELLLDLVNNKETSFGFRLTVNITGQIDYRTTTGNTICDEVVESVLHCRNWVHVAGGAQMKIRLQFIANTVPLDAPNKFIWFKVKVTPYEPRKNPEINMTDNSVSLQSRTVILSDLVLDGWSDPKQMHVQDSDRDDVTLTHKLLAVNRGPSFLPATTLLVHLPHSDSTGSDLLKTSNVTIQQADGMKAGCSLVLEIDKAIPTSPSTTTTTPFPSSTTTPPSDNNNNPFGDIEPYRRKRHAAKNSAQQSQTVGQQRMDCLTYSCRTYKCPLSSMQSNDKVDVKITVSLLRSAIIFPKNVNSLLYITRTNAVRPHHPLFYPWKEKKEREMVTIIKRVRTAKEVNIWFIIGGVLGGIFILVLIALLAYKLGFFKRKDKEKLENLKRENVFHEASSSRHHEEEPASAHFSPPASCNTDIFDTSSDHIFTDS